MHQNDVDVEEEVSFVRSTIYEKTQPESLNAKPGDIFTAFMKTWDA